MGMPGPVGTSARERYRERSGRAGGRSVSIIRMDDQICLIIKKGNDEEEEKKETV